MRTATTTTALDFDAPSAQEFADVMQAEQLVDLQKLKDLARRGVPFDVRGDVWMYLLGVLAADTSNEESLIRERLAEYDSLNKSNQKLEQTIRTECSRYYQRRLVAKMKPGRPKRPAVRTTEQPDREQAAAAELKRFTDKTESIICAYLNSKSAPQRGRRSLVPAPGPGTASSDARMGPSLGSGPGGWDARSASVPARPGNSRTPSEYGLPHQPNPAAAGGSGWTGSTSDSSLSAYHHRTGVLSSASSSEEHHSRSQVQMPMQISGHQQQQQQQQQRSHSRYSSDAASRFEFSPDPARGGGGWIPHSSLSEPSDGDASDIPPLQRLPPSLSADRRSEEVGGETYAEDVPSESSSFGAGSTSASTSASLAAAAAAAKASSTIPDAFAAAAAASMASSNPHMLAFPDVQPDFHPALVSLCAPFVECIRNETGMYFSFARLMQMLEDYNALYPLTERVSTFLTLFRITLPELHAYFEEEEVDIVGFATRWLQDLLSAEMRIDDVMRLWDAYFAQPDPLELHLYVCVAILMVLKDQLEELDHSECKSMLNALPDLDVELIVNEAINIRLSQQQSFELDD
ncbi:hypothetical protein OC844_005620 [Tilletia horrida]|nr:hypothetical protein OC844_005620 [Tilletia horrida]